ncbi:unnamed protein product [Sphagnum jensenii]
MPELVHMILFAEPSARTIEQFLSSQLRQELSYKEVGMTKAALEAPSGYEADHYRVKLGEGSFVFEEAQKALRDWQQFNLGWLKVTSPNTPIESGSVVTLLTSFAGFWLLFACRIVYVVNENGPIKKYGFAYGTLPGHPECGEERFTVEWDTSDNGVWYDVLAFSHPAGLVMQLGYPIARIVQKRFAKDSKHAMLTATRGTQ